MNHETTRNTSAGTAQCLHLSITCNYFQQEKGYALKKNLAELAIAANKIAIKKRTQEVDDER